MIAVIQSPDVPDTPYFTQRQIEPTITGDTLTLINGKGERRSWGSPTCTSVIVYSGDEFLIVHCSWLHKPQKGTQGGQQWYYFEKKPMGWQRITYQQTSLDHRAILLDCWMNREACGLPYYARIPAQKLYQDGSK